MYRSILVPVDGSSFGEQALPLALSIARRCGARLQLVQVHRLLGPGYAGETLPYSHPLDTVLRQSEKIYLAQLVKRVGESSQVPVNSALVEGTDIAEELRQQATAAGADLVVMTTHGRGPLVRSWLGSVADELVRRAPMPVLVLRPFEGEPTLGQEPACGHVLIPLDGSPLAERIIEPALVLGRLMGADYTLLRVINPMVLGGFPASLPQEADQKLLWQLQQLHEQERAEASTYLETVAQRLRGQSLNVRTRIAVHEQPAVAILEEGKMHRADLIALETHGRGGISRLFLGSVADKVLRGANVPVLVHHSKEANGRA